MDTLLLPRTDTGERYLQVAQEALTKSWELRAAQHESPMEIATFYYEQIFPRWGAAAVIRTDRGPEFNSEVVKEATRMMNTLHITGAADHP